MKINRLFYSCAVDIVEYKNRPTTENKLLETIIFLVKKFFLKIFFKQDMIDDCAKKYVAITALGIQPFSCQHIKTISILREGIEFGEIRNMKNALDVFFDENRLYQSLKKRERVVVKKLEITNSTLAKKVFIVVAKLS